jgi:hypothetical protein
MRAYTVSTMAIGHFIYGKFDATNSS